jgi:hypothetical protein
MHKWFAAIKTKLAVYCEKAFMNKISSKLVDDRDCGKVIKRLAGETR